MEKIFFIADTHFGDKNIIKYENRPFISVEEMDNKMINNWNDIVGVDDSIFVLGDFSVYNRDKTSEIINLLNGKKLLIIGNHDNETVEYYLSSGFKNVYDYPIIYNEFWILSHNPLYINTNMPYANIFGHVHSCKEYTDFSSQSFCASVERINYTPIEFNKIKEYVLKK